MISLLLSLETLYFVYNINTSFYENQMKKSGIYINRIFYEKG